MASSHARLVASLLLTACTGTVGGELPGIAQSTGGAAAVTSSGGAATMPTSTPTDLSRTIVRRLTRAEYDNTVRDLLADDSEPAGAFPVDEDPRIFDNNANALSFSPALADAAFRVTASLGALVLGRKTIFADCTPGPECARTFIANLGRKAWRRPLSNDEVERLFSVYARGERLGQGAFSAGIKLVSQAILIAPDFFYRFEFGDGSLVAGRPGLTRLSSWEMASRLSYSLWNSMPDDTLFARAASDSLKSPEAVAEQVDRMLEDPKTEKSLHHFHEQWLHLDMAGVNKVDYATTFHFTPEIGQAMQQEAETFLAYIARQGKLSQLFTADFSFANQTLAQLYGLPGNGAAPQTFARVSLVDNPARHAGFFSMPAFLAKSAQPDRSSPVLRGVFLLNRVLCRPVPPPGPDIDTTPQPATETIKTTRQYFETQHANNPRCAGCHTSIDAIGFGFEGYDAAGLPRTQQNGVAIDDTGFADETGPFKGTGELGAKLAASEDVRRCLARQWFRFFQGREEGDGDRTAIDAATTAAMRDDTFSALVREVAKSDAFLYLSQGVH